MGSQKGCGKTMLLIIFLSLILALPSVLSDEQGTTLIDAGTGQQIQNAVVIVTHDKGYGTEEIRAFLGNDSLKLGLQQGSRITIIADNTSTFGKDYYAKTDFADGPIQMFHSGTIAGIVKDRLDNVVGYADLKFECSNSIGSDPPEMTDRFGSFSFDSTPVGKCRVFANYGDAVGFKDVIVEHGIMTDVEIVLDKSIVAKQEGYDWTNIIIISLMVFILAVLFIMGIKKYNLMDRIMGKAKQRPMQKSRSSYHVYRKRITAERPEKKPAASKRAEDVMRTLNEKERAVVEHLLANKNKAAQSGIRHSTGLPRTTLARVIESLEKKNIIQVEHLGKAVKIELTGWFLGKE